jgi:hypothetical protein
MPGPLAAADRPRVPAPVAPGSSERPVTLPIVCRRACVCEGCGQLFTGDHCPACGRCSFAGRTYAGRALYCPTCAGGVRTCACGQTFKPGGGGYARCYACRVPLQVCPSCNRLIRGRCSRCALPPDVYAAVRESGPCVYCGDQETGVDHVWPLSRGGPDQLSNLVPACWSCNPSKGNRLLTEWDPARVARAVACSTVVASEWVRLTA